MGGYIPDRNSVFKQEASRFFVNYSLFQFSGSSADEEILV
jgi:hypothetical protein